MRAAGAAAGLTLASAPSRVPDPRLSAAARLDPYWGGVWAPGSSARWLSRPGAERLAGMGLGDLPAALASRTVPEAVAELTGGRARAARLSALAAIGMWRTLTSEQLAAVAGRAQIASPRSADRDVLWATGLVDRGRFVSDMPGSRDVTLWRPERAGDFGALSPSLSYADWVGVTGGAGWMWGSQFDRHNVLAAELGLRAAEYTDTACVLGESMAGMGRLSQTLGGTADVSATRAADALLVRADGMLVAVEITATVTSNLRGKIDNWASLLAGDPSRKLAVLFVECAHPDYAQASSEVHRQLRKAIAQSAHSSMAAELAEVPERMMLARWTDWFPGAGRLGRSFLSLDATRPAGPPGARWEPVSALDPFAFPWGGGDEDAESAVLERCRSLYGVPHWMRCPAPDYSESVRRRAGVGAAPRLPYSRDYRPGGRTRPE